MTAQFRTLLDRIDTAASRRAISQALKSFASELGFSSHASLDLQGGNIQYFGDYPEDWKRLYISERYCTLDPVIARARRGSGAFFWAAPDWLATRNAPLKRFAVKAMDHGVTHGLTISARAGFDRQLLLTFAGERQNKRPLSEQNLSDAVPVLMALQYRLKQIGGPFQAAASRKLSSRELQCLTWAAKGKTAVEIGLITRLSTRTIQHYLDSAREKLGATTVPHLVAISKDIKLI